MEKHYAISRTTMLWLITYLQGQKYSDVQQLLAALNSAPEIQFDIKENVDGK